MACWNCGVASVAAAGTPTLAVTSMPTSSAASSSRSPPSGTLSPYMMATLEMPSSSSRSMMPSVCGPKPPLGT